jgi:hypothetical protein
MLEAWILLQSHRARPGKLQSESPHFPLFFKSIKRQEGLGLQFILR